MEDQWLEGIVIKGYKFVIPLILSWKEDTDLVMEETVVRGWRVTTSQSYPHFSFAVKIWTMRSYSSDFARKWSHLVLQLIVLYVSSEIFI